MHVCVSNVFLVIIKAKCSRHGRATVFIFQPLHRSYINLWFKAYNDRAHTKRNNFFSISPIHLPILPLSGNSPNLIERYYTTRYKRNKKSTIDDLNFNVNRSRFLSYWPPWYECQRIVRLIDRYSRNLSDAPENVTFLQISTIDGKTIKRFIGVVVFWDLARISSRYAHHY